MGSFSEPVPVMRLVVSEVAEACGVGSQASVRACQSAPIPPNRGISFYDHVAKCSEIGDFRRGAKEERQYWTRRLTAVSRLV